MQNGINKPLVDKPSIDVALLVESDEGEDDNDLYLFVNTLENKFGILIKLKPQSTRTFNLTKDYD